LKNLLHDLTFFVFLSEVWLFCRNSDIGPEGIGSSVIGFVVSALIKGAATSIAGPFMAP
jgi:hypothetical protein